jgi:RHS repeat-associated protein
VGLDRFGRVVDDLWTNTSTSTTTDEFQMGYDLLGNVLYRQNTVNTAFGELYSYDALNQLASFQRGTLNSTDTGIVGTASASQNFSTDAVGNFTSVTTNGTAQTRTTNAQNQYTSISGATTPTYDSNGNMLTDETGRQFVYDPWNRLAAVKNSGGTTLETFGYDGLNRRVTQTASGTTTDLYYSKDWQVLEEMQGGEATARYVWSPVYVNALVLRDRATGTPGTLNERLWVQQDANWNVTALVNGSGVVVERYVYSPFGVVTIYNPSYTTVLSSSAYNWVYGFQGMRFDAVSGLSEADRRWYSPTQQRWISLDPERFRAGDVDLYRFVGNDPAAATDPTGLQPDGLAGVVTDMMRSHLPHGFRSIDEVAIILRQYPEVRDLVALFLVTGGTVRVGPPGNPFQGSYDLSRMRIALDPVRTRSPEDAASIFIVELLRWKSHGYQAALDSLAIRGLISKEMYIIAQERLGWDIVREHHRLVSGAQAAGIWVGLGMDRYGAMLTSPAGWVGFSEYYATQQRTGHSAVFGARYDALRGGK